MEIFKWKFVDGVMLLWHFPCRSLLMVECFVGVFMQVFVDGGALLQKDCWIYFEVQYWRGQQWFGVSSWKQDSCKGLAGAA